MKIDTSKIVEDAVRAALRSRKGTPGQRQVVNKTNEGGVPYSSLPPGCASRDRRGTLADTSAPPQTFRGRNPSADWSRSGGRCHSRLRHHARTTRQGTLVEDVVGV